jgi:hypothetical protein
MRLIELSILKRLILCPAGVGLLAGGVFSLAMQAKLWQYLPPKGPCAQFSFKATKVGDSERAVITDKFDTGSIVPDRLPSDSIGVVSVTEEFPRNVSFLLTAYSLRSPPAEMQPLSVF